jgi:hypothetical protein
MQRDLSIMSILAAEVKYGQRMAENLDNMVKLSTSSKKRIKLFVFWGMGKKESNLFGRSALLLKCC